MVFPGEAALLRMCDVRLIEPITIAADPHQAIASLRKICSNFDRTHAKFPYTLRDQRKWRLDVLHPRAKPSFFTTLGNSASTPGEN